LKQKKNSQPPETEADSPALDVSVLENPSPRFELEIVHRKAEIYLAQYIKILGDGDSSARQFATEKWPFFYAQIQAVCKLNGVSAIQEDLQPAQEFPPYQNIPHHCFPTIDKSPYSEIIERLSGMKRSQVDSR
jgi:hypothetical protein